MLKMRSKNSSRENLWGTRAAVGVNKKNFGDGWKEIGGRRDEEEGKLFVFWVREETSGQEGAKGKKEKGEIK